VVAIHRVEGVGEVDLHNAAVGVVDLALQLSELRASSDADTDLQRAEDRDQSLFLLRDEGLRCEATERFPDCNGSELAILFEEGDEASCCEAVPCPGWENALARNLEPCP